MKSSNTKLLTKEQILAAPEEEYMSDEQLAFFKHLLLELHDSTVTHIKQAKEQMERPHDSSDVSDIATWQEESNIALRIAEREQKLLPKIQQALERIRVGSFGYCLESGDPIGIPRLLIRPTAEYAIDTKELRERKEDQYKD